MAIDPNASDLAWSKTCITQWTHALAAGESQGRSFIGGARIWEDPPSHAAVLVLADAILSLEWDKSLLEQDPSRRGVLEQSLCSLAIWLLQCVREEASTTGDPPSALSPRPLLRGELLQGMAAQRSALLYLRFHALRLRHFEGTLLQILLSNSVRSAVVVGVDLLVDSPPHAWQDASLAIGALVQSNRWEVADVYPRLLDSTDPAVLAPALDLANLLFTERGVRPHPAADRLEELLRLLGSVVARLAMMEEDPNHFSSDISEVQRILFDSVSLTVSLCHTMARIGDVRAVGKLNQAMELGHRRIRAEAAYALVSLGEKPAVDRLLELAHDDALRPRILAYAKQLELADRIQPEWETPEARARSRLALHLSQPEHFSIAPHQIEFIDQRRLVIPELDEPQSCFLFRYTYVFGERILSNIGFVGPVVHLFSSHVEDMDSDTLYEIILQSLEE